MVLCRSDLCDRELGSLSESFWFIVIVKGTLDQSEGRAERVRLSVLFFSQEFESKACIIVSIGDFF